MQAAVVLSLTVWTRPRNHGNSKYSGHDTEVTCFHSKRAAQRGYLWLAWWHFFLGKGGDDGEPHLLLRTSLWGGGERTGDGGDQDRKETFIVFTKAMADLANWMEVKERLWRRK